MNPHDAVSDDGTRVECACGRTFEGHNAREDHAQHYGLERARAALDEAREGTAQ